jgi:hypothetical protein
MRTSKGRVLPWRWASDTAGGTDDRRRSRGASRGGRAGIRWVVGGRHRQAAALRPGTRFQVALPSVPGPMGPPRGEGFDLPVTAPALRPGRVAAATPVVRGPGCRWHGLPRCRFSGRLSRFGWGRLAIGARCLVGGVPRPTVRGRCYRRPEGAAASTDAGCAPTIVRPGEDCRRLKQCLTTPGTHGIFQC